MKKNNPVFPKKIGKEQSNGQMKMTEEMKSNFRVQRLTGAVIGSIKECTDRNDMDGLTFNEISMVLSVALCSYNKRAISAQFPQPKKEGS